ncbi:hypothetical protein [Priestia megaterium]|uniref:hypothetical protein n=1 Tax=Priestia megaterium TaxID=1404 RepID=UPI000BFC20AC|nr:hypothetical protein [Priestia megaterium]MBW0934216.1 hypothetical protein [Priestia megaterium]PGX80584.1 hypothetical protein COE31_04510 [Priestia megaterium]
MFKRFTYLTLGSLLVAGSLTGIQTSAAEDKSQTNSLDIQEIVKSTWNEQGKEGSTTSTLQMKKATVSNVQGTDNQDELIHNNGKPIDTDIIEKSKEIDGEQYPDQHLFAIYREKSGAVTRDIYYFEEGNSANLSDIKENVKDQQKKATIAESTNNMLASKAAVSKSDGYVKEYKWTFKYLGRTQGTYTSVNNFDRKSSNTNINGKTGSVWDVHSFNTYEAGKSGQYVKSQVTRMDAGYPAEKILSYGPKNGSGAGVSVSLSSAVDPMSWTFDIGRASLTDKSSPANKYGRWSYYISLGHTDPFNTEPGMRVSNTSGDFAMKISNTFTIYTQNHSTGIVTASLPDR